MREREKARGDWEWKEQNRNVNERYLSHTFVNSANKESENEKTNERAIKIGEHVAKVWVLRQFPFPTATQSDLYQHLNIYSKCCSCTSVTFFCKDGRRDGNLATFLSFASIALKKYHSTRSMRRNVIKTANFTTVYLRKKLHLY